jgi:pyridoxamine 5'-phosphate oxidase
MSLEKTNLQHLRMDYKQAALSESDVFENPIQQFNKWFNEALNAKILEPNAMCLATASVTGTPTARIVLLKEFDENGFVFYTNYESEKGKTLLQNPYASLVFFWGDLERQIRIEGVVEKVSETESDAYFKLRPKGSQLGAIVSQQSSEIPDRKFLEEKLEKLEKKYADKEVERPESWGGYRVIPNKIEFWQGRSNRLHDRLVYLHQKDGLWNIARLSP